MNEWKGVSEEEIDNYLKNRNSYGKEYYEKNSEYIKEYMKQYRQKNKEKFKCREKCEVCNCYIIKRNMCNHIKTDKHLNNLNKVNLV
jgi:hypothetical protein